MITGKEGRFFCPSILKIRNIPVADKMDKTR